MSNNFANTMQFIAFDRDEFGSLGLMVVEDYFDATDQCFNEFVTDMPKRIAEYEAKDPCPIGEEAGNF